MSAVPVIGSPAAELFGFLVVAPASRRRDEWIRSIDERLVVLESRIPGLIESLPSKDEFVTAALHATQVAMRSHQKEKLEALRNAVVNVAAGSAPDSDRQLIFLGWVDAFTPTHLAFLESLAPSCPDEQRAAIRAQLSKDRDLSDAVVIDLCIKNATINAKKGEVRIGGYSPVVSLATFESGRWNG